MISLIQSHVLLLLIYWTNCTVHRAAAMLLLMHRIVVLHTEWTLLYCTYKVCNLCSWYQNCAPTCLKNTSFFIFVSIRSFGTCHGGDRRGEGGWGGREREEGGAEGREGGREVFLPYPPCFYSLPLSPRSFFLPFLPSFLPSFLPFLFQQ